MDTVEFRGGLRFLAPSEKLKKKKTRNFSIIGLDYDSRKNLVEIAKSQVE